MFWKTPDSEMLGNVMVQQAISKNGRSTRQNPTLKTFKRNYQGKLVFRSAYYALPRKSYESDSFLFVRCPYSGHLKELERYANLSGFHKKMEPEQGMKSNGHFTKCPE